MCAGEVDKVGTKGMIIVGARHSQSIDVDRRPNAISIPIENDPCGMPRPYICHTSRNG
jgi:hypothetical protein